MPPASVMGGGPAGGGDPGGVSRNALASSSVLPGASGNSAISWSWAPAFFTATTPLAGRPSGGNPNEKSFSVTVAFALGDGRACPWPS